MAVTREQVGWERMLKASADIEKLPADRRIEIRYSCGHVLHWWRDGGVSDWLHCTCTACHPLPVHKSPFKCGACDPKHSGSFYVVHAIGGMSCCADAGVVDYHCKMELRKEGALPWHKAVPSTWTWSWGEKKGQKAYGLRIDCYKERGAFSLEAGNEKICSFCKQAIEEQALEPDSIGTNGAGDNT